MRPSQHFIQGPLETSHWKLADLNNAKGLKMPIQRMHTGLHTKRQQQVAISPWMTPTTCTQPSQPLIHSPLILHAQDPHQRSSQKTTDTLNPVRHRLAMPLAAAAARRSYDP
jgi:hypothetical protein